MAIFSDIIEMLDAHGIVHKRARGDEIRIGCLYHGTDNSMHMYINTAHALFLCHRCGEKGNAKRLAKELGDIWDGGAFESQGASGSESFFSKLDIYNDAAQWYQDQLNPEHYSYKYLVDKRGLTKETIEKARLGYAPSSGGLFGYLRLRGYDRDDIVASGLVNDGGGDFFRDKIVIPYFASGFCVQLRGKDINGKYLTPPDQDARLYGLDEVKDADEVIVCEGEADCFLGDTEVLTEAGWVKFEDYIPGTPVVQYEEGGALSLVNPLDYVSKFADTLISLRTNKRGGFDQVVTPGHRIVSTLADGTGLYVHRADDGPRSKAHHVPRAGFMDGPGLKYSDDEIRLMLAICADSTIDVRVYDGRSYCRFGFKRQRKIERIRNLLTSLRMEFSDSLLDNGYTSICFRVPSYLQAFKKFPINWLLEASSRQRELILQEMVLWDGNKVVGRSQDEFNSNDLDNVTWMQTLAHTSGRVSTLMNRSNEHGYWYKASILHKKRSTSWQSIETAEVEGGMVYCVTVPSGMLLVRRNREIVVSGNCLSLRQLGFAAVACPGAGLFKEDWAAWFENYRRVYICFDSDEAGQAGAERTQQILGRRTRIVQLPEGVGDINDWMVAGGTYEDFLELLRTSAGRRLRRVGDVRKSWEQLKTMEEGLYLGLDPRVDALLKPGFQRGQFIVLLGKTGSGKSVSMLNIAYRNKHIPQILISLEQTSEEMYERMRRISLFFNPKLSEEEVEEEWANILITDENKLSGREFEDLLYEYEEEMGRRPHLVWVDYLGYFARSYKGEEYQRLSDAVMDLKAMAKKNKVVIFSPHQVNRTGQDGRPLAADSARGAGTIEETGDFVFALWRPNEAEQNAGTQPGEVAIRILKSRHGGKGSQFTMIQAPQSLAYVPNDGGYWEQQATAEFAQMEKKLLFDDIHELRRARLDAGGTYMTLTN